MQLHLLFFCQYAEIIIDPTYAVYEKINYSKDKVKLDEITGRDSNRLNP